MFDKPEDFDAFEDAMTEKTRAEASKLRSEATLRLGVAGALILCGLAVVGYAGCLGYAKTQEPETEAAKAFMAAMKKPVEVEVTAKGTVTGTVNLADNQHVTVSGNVGVKDDARVALSVPPDATIGTRAVNDAQRPTPTQLQADARPASGAPVVTNFYRFKRVPFGAGEVQTGWVYESSDDRRPSEQFCQYLEGENGATRALVILGRDGVMTPRDSAPAGIDARAAFASCVWFSEQPARVNRDDNPPPPRHVITARAKS